MDRDFNNSNILAYGPTVEPYCQACKGNSRKPLSKGFAYHCVDNTSGLDFVAGPECRTKITHDRRTLSAIPHLGAMKPVPEETNRTGKGSVSAAFTRACDEEKFIADMSAWVQLRQERLPKLGFKSIAFEGLVKFQNLITNNAFDIEYARQVKKVYDSITSRRSVWSLENLQKCHDVAIQIKRVEMNPDTSDRNREFLTGVKEWMTSKYFLTPGQLQGIINIAKYRDGFDFISNLKFD